MPDLTQADDADSLSKLIIACSDYTMSNRMPDVLSAVIESPDDDSMSRLINPDSLSDDNSDRSPHLFDKPVSLKGDACIDTTIEKCIRKPSVNQIQHLLSVYYL
jgi:hypothetical protein